MRYASLPELDDVRRLWVRRAVNEGELPLYDLFSRDAVYLGSVRFAFQPAGYFPPRIRDGRLYTLVLDSLDVQTVVRVDLPDELRLQTMCRRMTDAARCQCL